MKGVNLDTYNLSLLTAKEDILNPRASTNWALFTYEGISNNLKLADSGAGGVAELSAKFHDGRPMYGLCRMGSTEQRIVMICWVGQNVDEIRRTECASHVPAIKHFFKEAHAFIPASSVGDVTEEKLGAVVTKVTARPPLQAQRRSSVPVDKEETVGTNYRRTNAAMEMRRVNRDSFWARAEREEEERKEEDKRRAAEERRRRERERIMQERKEAEERDRKMNEKLQMIEEQRRQQALMEEEMRRKEKSKWELEKREHEEEMRERFRRSESIEKAAEAAALVSQRSMNPRDFFRQLSSSSKSPSSPLSPNTGKPPFRRYRRSLTDTAFIFHKSDGTPTSPLSPRVTSPSPSPFGHSLRHTSASPPPARATSPGLFYPSHSPNHHALHSPPMSPQRATPPSAPLPSMPHSRPRPPSTLPPLPSPAQAPHPASPPPPLPSSPGLQASLVELPSNASATPPGGATAEPMPENENTEQSDAMKHAHGSLPESEAGLHARAVLVEEEEEEQEEKEEEEKQIQQEEKQVVVSSEPEPEAETVLEATVECEEAKPDEEAEEAKNVTEEPQAPQRETEVEVAEEENERKEEEQEMKEVIEEDEDEEKKKEKKVCMESGKKENESDETVEAGEDVLEQCEDLVEVQRQSRTLQNGTEKEYMHMTGMDKDLANTILPDDEMLEEGKEISENGNEGSPERQLCVRALYDYEAEDESELSFQPGDIISDVETVDKGWWRGFSQDGRQGLFPANYVETI
ncbi:drebrin-like protein A [Engraulis encrasicolus]|uniref:drebrin-like protein A n=1 Tax=Engraulis encrasicolus TaxID=184585 RepID=UPI002FD4D864